MSDDFVNTSTFTGYAVRFSRERDPGLPWELGDKFWINWGEHAISLICTGIENGSLTEGWCEELSMIYSFSPPTGGVH